MSFGETLKDLREEHGLTQSLLARYCGVSTQCISSLEMGTRNPTGSTLLALANYFHVSVDYLLGRAEQSDYIEISSTPQLSEGERELLELYNRMGSLRREDLLIYARALSGADAQSASKKKA